jgi:hypothetical protein
MADVLTIIAEAGAAGIAIGQLQKKSKLKQAALDEEIKRLRAEHQIAGPFKYKRSDYYYARGYEPGGETASRLIEVQIRNGGGKLLTKSNVEKAVKLPFKTFFKDGVRVLVGTGRAVELKGGASTYLFHVDAALALFPNLGTPVAPKSEPTPSTLKEQVLHAYSVLKRQQGGLSAVSIGKLLRHLGCSKKELHNLLLDEAQRGNADLHPTTLVDLMPEDREGVLPLPGASESAVTVTFRE